jgi:4-azaleucine resistance transporter AzlC
MHSLGFNPIYAILMSALIFAGSMEFIAAQLLLTTFDPFNVFLLTLMLNARHIFYGIALLKSYKKTGVFKYYLIFGLCDETFAINKSTDVPANIDKSKFYLYVTLLNHSYWVIGATIGSLLSTLISFEIPGIHFVMTALFVVIFMNQWLSEKDLGRSHFNSLLGVIITVICLIIFSKDNFMLISMLIIVFILLLKRAVERKSKVADS